MRRSLNPLKLLSLVAAVLLQACASLPAPVPREQVLAIPSSANETLGRAAASCIASPPDSSADSSFRPLVLGGYSMDARLALTQNAERSIDLQYYLLQDDLIGHRLLRAARDAALKGVRVRILIDDLYTARSSSLLVALAAYPNLQIRLFNPFAAGRRSMLTRWLFGLNEFSRVNHRMHNKLFIADGAFAIAGGRNIADEYFFASNTGNFVDFDLLVCGKAVPEMQRIYDEYWNSPRVYPLETFEHSAVSKEERMAMFEAMTSDAIHAQPVPAIPPDAEGLLGFSALSRELGQRPPKLLRGHIEVFADDPEKVTGKSEFGVDPRTVTGRLGMAMSRAEHQVVATSPYFIPRKFGMDLIAAMRKRGVRVLIMTNSLASNDEPLASAAYARYRVPLLKLGAEVYEVDTTQLKNDSLMRAELHGTVGRSHTKLVVIDGHTTFVGSTNLDLRSARLNTEFGMLVHSPELAQMVLGIAERVMSSGSFQLRLEQPGDHLRWVGKVDGSEVVYEDDPGVDAATRLKLLLFPFVGENLL